MALSTFDAEITKEKKKNKNKLISVMLLYVTEELQMTF